MLLAVSAAAASGDKEDIMHLVGDDADMIFTLRLNQLDQICWLYTLRNPQKLACVNALRYTV